MRRQRQRRRKILGTSLIELFRGGEGGRICCHWKAKAARMRKRLRYNSHNGDWRGRMDIGGGEREKGTTASGNSRRIRRSGSSIGTRMRIQKRRSGEGDDEWMGRQTPLIPPPPPTGFRGGADMGGAAVSRVRTDWILTPGGLLRGRGVLFKTINMALLFFDIYMCSTLTELLRVSSQEYMYSRRDFKNRIVS